MKLAVKLSVAMVAALGGAEAAEAPDLSHCIGPAGLVSAGPDMLMPLEPTALLVAENDVAPVAGDAPQPTATDTPTAPLASDTPAAASTTTAGADAKPAINIYSEITADKLSVDAAKLPTRIYVPNHSSNTVSVIDPISFKLVETIRVGQGPEHIIPSWDMKTLWVANNANQTTHGSMTPIDVATGKAGKQVSVDDPYNMYFLPDGSAAIVVAEAYHRLDLRDPQTMALKSTITVPDCKGINHADYTADYAYMLFTCEFNGKLVKVDVKNGTVLGDLKLSRPGSMPQDVRLSPDGSVFLVTDMVSDGVYFIDAATFQEVGFVHTGIGAHGLTTSRDGKKIYVANRGSNHMPDRAGKPGSVSVLDFASRQVERTWMIPGGGSPDMGNVTADGKQLWLSGRFDGQVYAIDTDSGAITKINVGIEPHGLAVWPQPGRFSLGHTGNMR